MEKRLILGAEPGVPTIDAATCTHCGLCADVCGSQPLIMRDGKVTRDPHPAIGCLGCGQCMAVCPTGSITVRGHGLSPEDRLPLPPREARATPDQLESLLLARRSIRMFSPREVERDAVETIIRMASAAPMGLPPSPVGVVAFHGREKVAMLAGDVFTVYENTLRWLNPVTMALLRPFIGKANAEIMTDFFLPLAGLMKTGRGEGRDYLLYDAPLALLFHGSRYADPADSHIAATYAMLAAESLGLGTCLLGDVAPVFSLKKSLKACYGIPRTHTVGLVLIAGYPKYRYSHAIRREFTSVTYM